MTIDFSAFFKDSHYPYYLLYQGFITLSLFLVCKLFRQGVRNRLPLILLLPLTLAVELVGDFSTGISWLYYIFNLFEYTFLCLYYLGNCRVSKFKAWVKYSVPCFVLVSLCISIFYYHFKSLPALNINLEGSLLIIIFAHLLFNLDINFSIYKHPDFWISTGILIYFGVIFVYFTFYRLLLHLNHDQTIKLFIAFSIPLNA